MKYVIGIVMTTLVWGAMASECLAQRKGPGRGGAAAVADADLEKEIGRTLAELNAERAAAKPDQAKITALTGTLRQLRARVRTQAGAADGTGNQGSACPFGGPGLGMGPGGGQGMGQGGGQGMGQGMGQGYRGGRGMGGGGGQGRGYGGGRR